MQKVACRRSNRRCLILPTVRPLFLRMRLKIHTIAVITVIAIIAAMTPVARANVYATDIKLNGKMTNVIGPSGTNLTISYILNEPATRGVVINILSGTNSIRSISVAAGSAGTLKGTNSVVWDGRDNGARLPAGGIYNIGITASATGYTNWTQISADTNKAGYQPGYYVFSPRGMAINTNPASLYYGRVFVGNAQNNFSGTNIGDVDGIMKLNADGSFADEGQSTGGYNWIDDGFNDSPHYLRYGQDDRIYALDFTSTGEVISFDMQMTSGSYRKVLSMNSYANNTSYGIEGWGTLDITDAGTTNGRIWLGDIDDFAGGLWIWHMTTNGVADPSDSVGTQVIAAGGDVSDAPDGGFMMDTTSNIFVSQLRTDPADPMKRTIQFTNWDGQSTLFTSTGWKVGSGDNTMRYIYDTVLDKRANPAYVALPMGIVTPSGGFVGGIRVLNAVSGTVVTSGSQSLTNLDSPNSYFGAAWDAVGNLYGASSSLHAWRVFSPPGTNQATTVAVETFQALQAQLPTFTSINITNGAITLRFTSVTTDTPSTFTLQSSTNAIGTYTNVTSAVISQTSPGVFKATAGMNGAKLFFRLKK